MTETIDFQTIDRGLEQEQDQNQDQYQAEGEPLTGVNGENMEDRNTPDGNGGDARNATDGNEGEDKNNAAHNDAENTQSKTETDNYTFEDIRAMSEILLPHATYGGNPESILRESQELLQLADMCNFGGRIRQLEIQGSVPMLLVAISGDLDSFIQSGGTDLYEYNIRFGHIWHFTRQNKGQPGDHMEFDFDPNTTEGFEGLAELSEGTIKKGLNEKWNFYLHN